MKAVSSPEWKRWCLGLVAVGVSGWICDTMSAGISKRSSERLVVSISWKERKMQKAEEEQIWDRA